MNKGYYRLMKLMLMFVIALALISAVSSAVSASGCRTGTPLYFNVIDLPPDVYNVTPPAGTEYNVSSILLITANVTDDVGISTVYANITLPNGTVFQIPMSDNDGDSIYNATFTNLILRGIYNITIFANDISGNINDTETTYINRIAPGGKIIDVINQTVTYEFYNVTVMNNASGLVDLNVSLFGTGNMKYIEVYNHTESDPYSVIRIGYNETPGGDWHIQWSIDLTGINLTHATVALNATGRYLFKCNDSNFNFTTQRCDDAHNYTQIRTDIIPGQIYYEDFHISNLTDPAYIEAVQGADNTSDAWLRSQKPNQNRGGQTLLRAGRFNKANRIERSIIKFNLSSIPTNVNVTNASLELFFWRIPGGDSAGSRTHDVHLVNQTPARDWVELDVTWNDYNSTGSWTNAGGDYLSTPTDSVTFDSSALDSWIRWNVTSDVQSVYDNQTFNFGWIIKDSTEDTNRIRRDYHSSEYSANVSRRPRLIIEYSDLASSIIIAINCTPDPANVSDNVTCTANVTDNVGIGTVIANVTHTNGSVISQTVNCTGTNTLQTCNFTFVQTTQPGLYNVSWFANDTSNNNASAQGDFTVADLSSPSVVADCQPDPANIGDNVTCTANITDNYQIDNITASVAHINGTLFNQTLFCAGTNVSLLCNFTFNQTTLAGTYNISWFANDTSSNNATALDSFIVQNVTPPGPPITVGPGRSPGGGGLGWDPRYASAATVHGMPEPAIEGKPAVPAKPIVGVPRLITNITIGEPEEPPKDYIVKAEIFYIELIFTVLSVILLIWIMIMIAYTEIKMRKYRKRKR